MRVHGQGEIAGRRRHLDGQQRLGDHLARLDADDADAEEAVALRIDTNEGPLENADRATGWRPQRL